MLHTEHLSQRVKQVSRNSMANLTVKGICWEEWSRRGCQQDSEQEEDIQEKNRPFQRHFRGGSGKWKTKELKTKNTT